MINKIARNKYVQNFINKTQKNPKFYKKINDKLPILETSVATLCYSACIYQNKSIEKERKPALHYQNWIGGAAGILLGSRINKFVNKHKDSLCKELQKRNIYKCNNVIKGVQVALPLVIFSALLRFIIPVISTPISTKLERIRNKTLDK